MAALCGLQGQGGRLYVAGAGKEASRSQEAETGTLEYLRMTGEELIQVLIGGQAPSGCQGREAEQSPGSANLDPFLVWQDAQKGQEPAAFCDCCCL